MKKALSLLLAAAIVLSIAGCGQSAANTDNQGDTTASVSGEGTAEALSNPVALTEDGDIDMEVALAYQTDIDALVASLEAKEIDPTDTVSDNSNEKTTKVFNWLREQWGKKVILGQQQNSSKEFEDQVYYSVGGDLPAIRGYDMIFCTGAYLSDDYIDSAIEWHTNSNGLVSFCWHWNVPRDIDDTSKGYAFYSEDITNFSFENAVTPGTKEYEVVIHDIDLIATKLQRLEAAGVPVIWRPLHEASGSWFWWGLTKESFESQCYQKLWYIIYDRLENYHKLTNLIWAWNGQSDRVNVNPNTYDIAGTDIYPDSEDHSSQISYYNNLEKITGEGKMIALTECGYIPDAEEMWKDGANWLYYMPWNDGFIFKTTGSGAAVVDIDGNASINTDRMSEEFLKKQFDDDTVITWSDLPDWGGTERNLPNRILLWKAGMA